MRVGVDMYYAQSNVAFNGIGNYAFSHITHLLEYPDIQLYYFQPNYLTLTKEQYKLQLSNFITANQLDIFHFPSPMQMPYPDVIPRLPQVRLTALVHDIIPLIYPDRYLPDKYPKQLYYSQLSMLKTFDHIFTNSEFTRQDLMRVGIAPESITTAGVGCDDFFVLEQADLQDLQHLFPIDKPYVMAFNPADYRKNAERIIRAFSRAVRDPRVNEDVRLLFVNHISEAMRGQLDRLSSECGIADRIHYTGRINKSQLLRLYNRARGLVFPSLYEGVGLPALEAMLCGLPVLTSNTTSMPEVVGDAAIQVDPLDVNHIAAGLVELISNTKLRRELVERGFRQVGHFQWTAVAYRTVAKFRELMKQAPVLRSLIDIPVANTELEDSLHQLKSDLTDLRSDINNKVSELYRIIDRVSEQPVQVQERRKARTARRRTKRRKRNRSKVRRTRRVPRRRVRASRRRTRRKRKRIR